MRQIFFSKKARKSLRHLRNSGRFDQEKIIFAINTLTAGETLLPQFRNHPLQGKYIGCFECHLKDNLLMIYEIDYTENTLVIVDIGTHSELFE